MKKALEVRKDIHWVGALDFDIRVFDVVMYTEFGTTYNSYVVKGSEKTALIEIAKESFYDEFLERLNQVTDPTKIDYIIVNHTEPDHTGSLRKLLDLCPSAKVVGSAVALRFLKDIVNRDFESIAVKDGDTIDIGGKTLKFISAPFLHWADSMYTYIPEDKTIFTCDSFGCHYCDENVFNDKIHGDFIDAYKYYFDCIMGPFKSYVLDAIEKIKDLQIETICPGHGPVLREQHEKYIELYKTWAQPTAIQENKIVIPFATAYGYTKQMAEKISDGIKSAGDFHVELFDMSGKESQVANVLKEISDAKGIIFGSSTILGDTLPPIWELLINLNPIIHSGKICGVFGSYGWSGEAVTNIEQRIKQLRFKMPLESLKVKFHPTNQDLEMCFDYGKKFAEALNN